MIVFRLALLAAVLSQPFAASATAQPDEPPPVDYPALPSIAATAEEFVSPGWTVVSKAEGDLNRDGRGDVALALWTEQAARATSSEEMREAPPYRLVIGFAQSNGGYRLITDNRSLLVPPGASGMVEDPLDGETLRIVRGSLDMSRDLLRGHYRYRFRWSNGAFRLTGYEEVISDGRCITDSSINYLTRKANIETEGLGDESETHRYVRRIKRPPVTIEEASAEDYYPHRDLTGPPTYCVYKGQRF